MMRNHGIRSGSSGIGWAMGVLLLFSLFGGNSLLADLQNGDFSSGLTDWTVVGPVSTEPGLAVLGEDDWGGSTLEQLFEIPANSATLSFDYLAGFEADGEENFNVSLLDPGASTDTPLIPTDIAAITGSETYYFTHEWDDYLGLDRVLYDPTYVSVTDIGDDWMRVSLDLASLGGLATNALLAFDFVPGLWDGNWFDGQIRIDNVEVVPVPAPAAVVLAMTGFGTALYKLRKRQDVK